MAQHLAHMRAGEPFLKPVYRHDDGTFGPPVLIEPKQFSVIDGLLGYYNDALRGSTTCACSSPRPRSCAATGRCSATARAAATRPTRCSPSSTAASPTRRVHPAAAAPRRHRRLVHARRRGDQEHLDAELVLRSALKHPDLTGAQRRAQRGIKLDERDGEAHCSSRATSTRARGAESRRRSGSGCTSRATCAPTASASSRSAPSCTARSRWRSSSSDPVPPRHRPRGVALGGEGTREPLLDPSQ